MGSIDVAGKEVGAGESGDDDFGTNGSRFRGGLVPLGPEIQFSRGLGLRRVWEHF